METNTTSVFSAQKTDCKQVFFDFTVLKKKRSEVASKHSCTQHLLALKFNLFRWVDRWVDNIFNIFQIYPVTTADSVFIYLADFNLSFNIF